MEKLIKKLKPLTPKNAKEARVMHQTLDDVRNATLIVSVLVNLFILTTWLVWKTTTEYDTALASLFQR